MSHSGDKTEYPRGIDQSFPVINTLTPNARISLPVTFVNPNNPDSERSIAELSVDNLFVKEIDLKGTTENLLINLTPEIHNVDQSLQHLTQEVDLISESQENPKVQENSKSQENPDYLEYQDVSEHPLLIGISRFDWADDRQFK